MIDEGAYKAIGRRESGGRLLPAGVIRVEGPFAAHQAVRLIVRRKKRFPPPPLITNPESEAVTPARMSPDMATHDHTHLVPDSPAARVRMQIVSGSTSSSPDTAPQPGTPLIQPALSLSSSVVSLDPLSRTGPSSPAMRALGDRLTVASLGTALEVEALSVSVAATAGEWEEVEVGKGLAQYNSVAIDRIKGMKR